MAGRSDSFEPMPTGNGYAISRDLSPKLVDIEALKPLGRQTRKHPAAQVRKLAASLQEFGFVLPVITDPTGRVVGGWGLVLGAKRLGLREVPAVTITDKRRPRPRSRHADEQHGSPAASCRSRMPVQFKGGSPKSRGSDALLF
jgi:hypothetical protein